MVDRDEIRDQFAQVRFVAPVDGARTFWHAQYDVDDASWTSASSCVTARVSASTPTRGRSSAPLNADGVRCGSGGERCRGRALVGIDEGDRRGGALDGALLGLHVEHVPG